MDRIRLCHFVLLFSSFCSFSAFAELASSIDSSIYGVTIPNAHYVGSRSKSLVVRGQAPQSNAQIDQLLELGIKRVLIFKTDTKGEVAKERAALQNKGFRNQDILQVDMPWKEIADFQEICQMTLQSLKFIEDSVRAQKGVFFHCTVGEDRTGYLAGLWGLWNEDYRTVTTAFNEEMCARGFESGNAQKPFHVAKAVRENLTPAFMKMVTLLAESRISGLRLNQIKCPKEIVVNRALLRCH